MGRWRLDHMGVASILEQLVDRDNWNANVIRIPYDSVNHTWNLSDPNAITYTWHNMGVNPNYFQAGLSPSVQL